jgi:hypothetical protein
MRTWLAVRAWTELLYLDLVSGRGFRAIQGAVQRTPTRPRPARPDTVTAVVAAVQTAGVLYVKPAPCLQRAAVVTRLLRRCGVPATLVIGCHIPPLRAHAWVEVAGDVISERVDGLEHFRVLDRW